MGERAGGWGTGVARVKRRAGTRGPAQGHWEGEPGEEGFCSNGQTRRAALLARHRSSGRRGAATTADGMHSTCHSPLAGTA